MSQVIDACVHKPESNIICVSPLPKEFMLFESNEYKMFEKYGKLRFVGFDERRNDGPVIGFIEFENEDVSVADQLITRGYLEIEDKKIQVKSYTEFKRRFRHISATVLEVSSSIDPLLQPSEPDSPTNILNALIDDCLHEIFKKLHFSTLNSVANVCVHFNRIAKEAFFSKYQSKQINLLDLKFNRNPTISTVEEFLSNFGESISSLSTIKIGLHCAAIGPKDADTQLKLINKYCKKLDKLEFNFKGNVTDETLYEVRGLFQRLKKLRVMNSKNCSLFEIISYCSELEILEINDFWFTENSKIVSPKIACPKLVEVHFLNILDNPVLEAILKFLVLNTQLKILEIDRDLRSNILTRFNELNELTLKNVFHLSSLLADTLNSQNLKLTDLNLNLWTFHYEVNTINIISKFGNITGLEIGTRGINKDNLIYLLKKMPNIESLHFRECYNREKSTKREDFDAVDKSKTILIQTIVQHANRLKNLKIVLNHNNRRSSLRQYPIDITDYYEILKTVKNRIKRFKLTVQLIIPTHLKKGDAFQAESIGILNMVPDLLSIELRTTG